MRRNLLGAGAWAVFAIATLQGCSCGELSADYVFHRMELQQRYTAYEANPIFADGRAMRPPPEGTVPRERQRPGDRAFHTGVVNNEPVTKNPVRMTPALLALGKKRYEVVCAQCHGLLGDGRSVVADNMGSRLPPNLHDYRDRPDGFFFGAITQGYGYMPSFAGEIPTEERWAVVAYVRALQKSRNVRFGDLTVEQQEKVRQAAIKPEPGAADETKPIEFPSAEEKR